MRRSCSVRFLHLAQSFPSARCPGVAPALLAWLLGFAMACNARDLTPGAEDERPPQHRDAGDAGDAGSRFPVELGIPDELVSTTFVALEEDGDVRIQDGGQGGTHALVALRFRGLGQWIFYKVSLENLEGEGKVETPDLVRPMPTLCDDERYECRKSPILVVIGGLAPRDTWDGLHVQITATVSNEAGEAGSATTRAYLRR